MINIEAFPASYGESILVSIGENNTKNILIDLGFSSTYHNHVKKRLQEISAMNQSIDLLVITHYDADHIRGAIELLKDNGMCGSPKIVKIEDIWINQLKHMEFGISKIEINEREKLQLKLTEYLWNTAAL